MRVADRKHIGLDWKRMNTGNHFESVFFDDETRCRGVFYVDGKYMRLGCMGMNTSN